MNISVPPRPGKEAGTNPWRPVLELRIGLGPDLPATPRGARDRPLLVAVGAGLTLGFSSTVVMFALFPWLLS